MDRATRWIVGPDTGVSSKTIWSVMHGVEPRWADTPSDPDDFGRCFRLLLLVPEYKKRLQEVAYRYPEWAPLVREWDSLSALYLEELPSGRCEKLYHRMKHLNDEGLILRGWTLTSPGSGSGPARGHKVPREAIEKALREETPAQYAARR